MIPGPTAIGEEIAFPGVDAELCPRPDLCCWADCRTGSRVEHAVGRIGDALDLGVEDSAASASAIYFYPLPHVFRRDAGMVREHSTTRCHRSGGRLRPAGRLAHHV